MRACCTHIFHDRTWPYMIISRAGAPVSASATILDTFAAALGPFRSRRKQTRLTGTTCSVCLGALPPPPVSSEYATRCDATAELEVDDFCLVLHPCGQMFCCVIVCPVSVNGMSKSNLGQGKLG